MDMNQVTRQKCDTCTGNSQCGPAMVCGRSSVHCGDTVEGAGKLIRAALLLQSGYFKD